MSDRIKVTFTRPFRAYRKGDVIEMDRGPAKSWIQAGVVTQLADQEQRLIEEAVFERRAETADAPRRRRRR